MAATKKRKRLGFPRDWFGWAWEYKNGSELAGWPRLDVESFDAERCKPKYVWSSLDGEWVRVRLAKVEVAKRSK